MILRESSMQPGFDIRPSKRVQIGKVEFDVPCVEHHPSANTRKVIIGVRVWSQRSWAFSTLFIVLPAVCLYGIWAFFAFR